MDISIKDVSQEQYDKIMSFVRDIVPRKYDLSIWVDDCMDWQNEVDLVFERDGIEDVKFLNNLRDYSLFMKNNEVNPEYWDEEELKADGYHLFYIESYIHSGIHIYEYNGCLRDRWDCGIAGIMAIKGDKEKAHKAFLDYLELYNKISDNDFYGYTVYDNYGEMVDSCGGFWDVKDMREYIPDYITDEQIEKAKDNIQY